MRKVLVVNEADSPGAVLVRHLDAGGAPVASYTLAPTQSVVVQYEDGQSFDVKESPAVIEPEPEDP